MSPNTYIKTTIIIIIILLFLTIICAMAILKTEQTPVKMENDSGLQMEKIKGVCWEGTRMGIEPIHMESLENHHANWISLTPFGWQDGIHNPEIVTHRRNRGRSSDREKGMENLAKIARAKGIKTLLKPHIWLSNANGKWRSDIKMNSPEEWDQWFDQYYYYPTRTRMAEHH